MVVSFNYMHPIAKYGVKVGKFTKVEIRAEGYAVVDGVAMDLRGASTEHLVIHRGTGGAEAQLLHEPGIGYNLHITQVYTSTEKLPARSSISYTRFPQYPIWDESAQTPQIISSQATGNIVEVADSVYADLFKDDITAAAKAFESAYNPFWGAFSVLEDISGSFNNADPIQTQAKKRQKNTGNWGRVWVGLMAGLYWHLKNGSIEIFPGLQTTFTRKGFESLIQTMTSNLKDYGIFNFFRNHNVTAFETALAARQLTKINEETGSVSDLVWTAPSAEWFRNVATRWFHGALFDKYPAKGSLSISSPNIGTVPVRISFTDPAGAPIRTEYQWQLTSDNGVTVTNITGGTNVTHTPEESDRGKKLRAVMTYENAGGFLMMLASAWQKIA